ncbi:VOC family protein [Dongia deserti]|uniref:VOC family protein n=1 Tax=Dongia deserti TaxID=2268030 RepID=UPI000E65AD1F|nr:VOC family protein [Dongia deserti]
MKFGYTIIYVDSVETTIAFYETAFGLKRGMVAEGEFGELATGETKLAFAAKKMIHEPAHFASADGKVLGVEIALTTDDVPAAFDKAVAAGAKLVSKPEKKSWGQIVAYVRDNNGFLVELCTPMG